MNRSVRAVAVFASILSFSEAADTLTGRVVGIGKVPLAGVKVTLARLNVSDTTGADGLFELKLPVTSVVPWKESHPRLTLGADGSAAEIPPARDALGRSAGGAPAFIRMFIQAGSMYVQSGSQADPDSRGLSKSSAAFAEGDTLALTKAGWFAKKIPMPSLATQNMGDLALSKDWLTVNNSTQDRYNQFIVDAYKKNGLDSTVAMILKAMIVIESSFNANAISMYDVQLPCGTHSYGLIQVTPGCVKGYATLPASTAVTATISGGLSGNPAVLTYADPADKAAGNTIVKENGIVINLVSNPANPLWASSAFNPAYSIDNGAKTLASVMGEMKRKFTTCSEANYVTMALAGYNQGSGTVTGCTSFSAGGVTYSTNVLNQDRKFCAAAGLSPVY